MVCGGWTVVITNHLACCAGYAFSAQQMYHLGSRSVAWVAYEWGGMFSIAD
jgi:hypothetical protein